mgnify:CR=1 FL=1|jgi:hypothetical protein
MVIVHLQLMEHHTSYILQIQQRILKYMLQLPQVQQMDRFYYGKMVQLSGQIKVHYRLVNI